MNGQISNLMILYKVLINPIRTVKGIHLLNYDRKSLKIFYYVASTILVGFFVYLKFGGQSLGLLLIGIVLAPFIAYTNQLLITSIYYVLFSYIGGIDVSYYSVKIMLFPIILIELLFRLLFNIIFIGLPIFTSIWGVYHTYG